jgi:hypothetical protein
VTLQKGRRWRYAVPAWVSRAGRSAYLVRRPPSHSKPRAGSNGARVQLSCPSFSSAPNQTESDPHRGLQPWEDFCVHFFLGSRGLPHVSASVLAFEDPQRALSDARPGIAAVLGKSPSRRRLIGIAWLSEAIPPLRLSCLPSQQGTENPWPRGSLLFFISAEIPHKLCLSTDIVGPIICTVSAGHAVRVGDVYIFTYSAAFSLRSADKEVSEDRDYPRSKELKKEPRPDIPVLVPFPCRTSCRNRMWRNEVRTDLPRGIRATMGAL